MVNQFRKEISYMNNNRNNDYNGKNDYYLTNHNTPYTLYPEPKIIEEKPKKKKFIGMIKFTAAAVAFGIIASATMQGYNYFTRPKNVDLMQNESGSDLLQINQENTEDTADIIPINNIEDAVISDVSDVVEKVMPSIVAINSSATISSYDFFGRRFVEPVKGSGSGIIVGQNASQLLIVTNNHVIEGAEKVEIIFGDETVANAKVKGSDARTDLAVLTVDLDDLSEETVSYIKVASLGDSNAVKAGEMAIAIGNALGYGQSVTVGYISAINREIEIEGIKMTLIQTDAAINPGNSGGALISTSGKIIGINSIKFASAQVEGMGYAIPISDALPMINKLINREKIDESEQGFLGIALANNVTEIWAQEFNMPMGVYIKELVKNSPAEEAGLQVGQIIVKLDGQVVETTDDLRNILTFTREGQTVEVVVKARDANGQYVNKVYEVTLAKKSLFN